MAFIDRITAWVNARLGLPPEVLARIVATLLVAIAYGVAVRVARRIIARTVDDPSSRYQIGKATGYLFGFVAFAFLVKIWLQGFTGLATYLGLLSAGLAVALQDPIINLAAWLFIIARRPFQVGERIQIGNLAGDVVDQRLFQFTLLEIGNWVASDQSTGRVVHVPNGWVFKNSIANYDGGFSYIWNEIPVMVTFESDWRKAKQALLRIVTEHAEHLSQDAMRQIESAAQRYHLRYKKLTPIVWTKVVDSGIVLTIRYLCKPRSRRSSEEAIWEAVLDQFARMPDVDFAYPTTRFYDNVSEGKPEARAADPRDADRMASLPAPPIKIG